MTLAIPGGSATPRQGQAALASSAC